MEILKLSLRDFFSKEGLKLTFFPFIFAFLVFVVSLFLFYEDVFTYFSSFISESKSSFLSWLYSFSFVQILNNVFAFLVSFVLFNAVAIAVALLIVGFLTPFVVKFVNSKHYTYEAKESVSMFKIFAILFTVFFKFALIFILSLFLIFVPFVGIFLLHLSLYYLFHKCLIIDVFSTVLSKDEFLKFYKHKPLVFYFSTLCFYLLSLLPILGIFLQVFFVIFLSHLLYQKILKLSVKH
ncbi:EI24 domain-containing protein [uncultured Campylobacter sp.]|uniref:EI24 domain-containing protein n=1 Tax=uncultured Campylobacter sp. TaxID=218934 RepID=UPI00262C1CBE|nr:EI24 domain-containing protein [uncultured Campylobacter sp.]